MRIIEETEELLVHKQVHHILKIVMGWVVIFRATRLLKIHGIKMMTRGCQYIKSVLRKYEEGGVVHWCMLNHNNNNNSTVFAMSLDYFNDVQALFNTLKLPVGIWMIFGQPAGRVLSKCEIWVSGGSVVSKNIRASWRVRYSSTRPITI